MPSASPPRRNGRSSTRPRDQARRGQRRSACSATGPTAATQKWNTTPAKLPNRLIQMRYFASFAPSIIGATDRRTWAAAMAGETAVDGLGIICAIVRPGVREVGRAQGRGGSDKRRTARGRDVPAEVATACAPTRRRRHRRRRPALRTPCGSHRKRRQLRADPAAAVSPMQGVRPAAGRRQRETRWPPSHRSGDDRASDATRAARRCRAAPVARVADTGPARAGIRNAPSPASNACLAGSSRSPPAGTFRSGARCWTGAR